VGWAGWESRAEQSFGFGFLLFTVPVLNRESGEGGGGRRCLGHPLRSTLAKMSEGKQVVWSDPQLTETGAALLALKKLD